MVLSGLVVAAFGVGLIGFAVVCAVRPARAERFLRAFASSARAHYAEQALRLVAGSALVHFAPSMWHPTFFRVLGWLIVITAVGLILTPWRWHRRFGEWAIPLAVRHLRWYALGAAGLGAFILYAASRAVWS